MFSDDKNIESLKQLFFDFKKYLEVQKEYAELEVIEKLTKLFSTLVTIFILIALGMMALFYLLFAFAYVIAPDVGGLAASFGILVLIIVVISLFVIIFKKAIIIKPLVNYLANLFYNPKTKK